MSEPDLRVLFVDDDPEILEGLRLALLPKSREWSLSFANGGVEALERLRQEPFDVIVTDMQMPELDGVALLTEVQASFPDCLRIVLSAHPEFETTLRAIPIAHHFIVKPATSTAVIHVVEQARKLQGLLRASDLRRLVDGVEHLPSPPGVFDQITAILADPNADIGSIASTVEGSASVAARVIQTVNSAAFGLRNPVISIAQAIQFIGLNMLRNIVLCEGVWGESSAASGLRLLSIEAEHEHASTVAVRAMRLPSSRYEQECAYVGGFMHDIGKVVLAANTPGQYEEVLDRVEGEHVSFTKAEKSVYGCSHAEVGAYLLDRWQLPYPIVEAVALHHSDFLSEDGPADAVHAVHDANAAVRGEGTVAVAES